MREEIEKLILELRDSINECCDKVDENNTEENKGIKETRENIELLAKSREDFEIMKKLTKILYADVDQERWSK